MESTKTQSPSNEIGIFQAKTNLSVLINRVQCGEVIIITRNGDPVAKLVPFDEVIDRVKVHAAAERLMHFGEAEGLKLPKGCTIKSLIKEGRR